MTPPCPAAQTSLPDEPKMVKSWFVGRAPKVVPSAQVKPSQCRTSPSAETAQTSLAPLPEMPVMAGGPTAMLDQALPFQCRMGAAATPFEVVTQRSEGEVSHSASGVPSDNAVA